MTPVNLSPEPEARDDEGRAAALKSDGVAVNLSPEPEARDDEGRAAALKSDGGVVNPGPREGSQARLGSPAAIAEPMGRPKALGRNCAGTIAVCFSCGSRNHAPFRDC